ncbi:uncharacterized protein YqgV (UPF0045/DUF77 family) [Kutzneria viridogrisea]|uniref:Uncharacterized protein YqgV (UPF0045/DUF77 family) n=1 Tax=Kutzneria viridogrisea TaxID=47990 RepID=A0ABR6BCH5_9PSEU|nr:uncharacterized protein YqgV (UPF0045/DUF77 family) [Kutzneria viridogrisea]
MDLEAEFTTEPFLAERHGEPPEHAARAKQAALDAGLDTTFGPLGTTVRGEDEILLAALPEIVRAAMRGGATRVTLRLNVLPAQEVPARHGLASALEQLLGEVAAELGGDLADLTRADKQRAVRLLEERGAFSLRKSVPAVAEALGVTRFTVYNYLNREDT